MICNKLLGQQKELNPLLLLFIEHDITKHRFIKTTRFTESTYQQCQEHLVSWPLLHGLEWNFERCWCTEDKFRLKLFAQPPDQKYWMDYYVTLMSLTRQAQMISFISTSSLMSL